MIGQSRCMPVLSGTPSNSRTSAEPPDGDQSQWVSGPSTRGTCSLLLSCFTTLFLCAWTAYHPNIPQVKSNLPGRRAKWIVATVFAPELVLFAAWVQYVGAQRLKKEINTLGAASVAGESVLKLSKVSFRFQGGAVPRFTCCINLILRLRSKFLLPKSV